MGITALAQGEYTRARALLEESLSCFSQAGDNYGRAFVLCHLTVLSTEQGDYTSARSWGAESLELFRKQGARFETIEAIFTLAKLLFLSQGEPAAIDALLEESFHLARVLDEKWPKTIILRLAAQIALSQRDVDKARLLIEESMASSREAGSRPDIAEALVVLGQVATAEGDLPLAQASYEECLVIARETHYQIVIAPSLEGLAALAAAQGVFMQAARLWGAAEAYRESMGTLMSPVERSSYRQTLAKVGSLSGESTFAAAWAQGRAMTPEQALTAPEKMPEYPSVKGKMHGAIYPDGLTMREVEVLRLVAQGLTNAQIAEQLVISPRTVNTHLTSIYNKIHVSSRAAATRYALEHYLS